MALVVVEAAATVAAKGVLPEATLGVKPAATVAALAGLGEGAAAAAAGRGGKADCFGAPPSPLPPSPPSLCRLSEADAAAITDMAPPFDAAVVGCAGGRPPPAAEAG